MKNKRYLYKKVKRWKKKPDRFGVVAGIVMLIVSWGMFFPLYNLNSQVALLSFIFASMFFFSIRIINKSWGKGKQIYYLKTRKK